MSASWKTIRVFISSTFRDMQAERDWLVRFVFPKLREELVKYRIHLVDVDLRWGVTGDQDALGVCREVIDECHPRFMGMLGGRYGWVPEEQDKSITADEIHYGVLEREAEKQGHAFFYFRDASATERMAEETPGEFREPEGSDKAKKLAALKNAITDAGLPVFIYDAQWDTAQKRLTGLKAFGNRVHNDLLKSLKEESELAAHFTTDGTAPLDEFADEAEQMDAFIEERTDRFALGSREPLMKDLLAFAAADGAPNIFVLTGEPGSGKSAFLAKFCRSLASSSGLLVSHFVGASTGSTDLRRTLRRLCHELAKAAGNTEPLPLDIKELITHFQKLLAEAAAKQRVILVFDALNQFDETDGAHWMNWLPRELPPGVRIVTSVISSAEDEKEHQTLAILRNRKDARIEELKPLDESDALAIIEDYLKRYSKRLSKEQIAALIDKPASNLPLYVLTALEELRTLGTYEEITDRIRTLPGDTRALFGWILTERLARDPGFRDREGRPCGAALVEKFAACLGVSRHGLSPAELAALLDPGDPLGNVAALLRLLRPYLMRRGELLDFYHGQFREAAVAAHLDSPEKQRAAHQSVATCLRAFADPHRDGQCREATPHALSELPHHQTRAEAWPDLIATLENIFFLEAKVTHGMAFDLTEDFTAVVDALPLEHPERQRLRLLLEALRRDIHFIARHEKDYPQGLFQCLWNLCWWYDCPEAEPHYVVPESGWKQAPPWQSTDPVLKLCTLLQRWRIERESAQPDFPWVRTLRPPYVHLGAGQLAVLRGHKNRVSSVAFSPDGLRVVSGSGHDEGITDNTVRIWDALNGQELAVLRGHERAVNGVAFSPDGFRVISGSNDKTLRLWDALSGRELAVLRGHEHSVNSVAFSPDGFRVVSGGDTVRLWDVRSGEELAVLCGQDNINSVAFSPDGRCVLSGGGDTVRLWDVQSGKELAVLRGQDDINSVAFSPDGRWLLSGSGSGLGNPSSDNTVRLWNAKSGHELAVLHGHDIGVTSVAFSPDGLHVLSGSWDKTMRLWDARSGRELSIMRQESPVTSVAFSPDGLSVVCGLGGGLVLGPVGNAVLLWDVQGGRDLAVLRGHGDMLMDGAISPDGCRVATLGLNDSTVRLWDAENGRELFVLSEQRGTIMRVTFSPDGRRIFANVNIPNMRECEMRVFDARSGELLEMRGEGDPAEVFKRAAVSSWWRANLKDDDTVIEPYTIAWFPDHVTFIDTRSQGREHRTWAGYVGSHFVLLRLEGGDSIKKDFEDHILAIMKVPTLAVISALAVNAIGLNLKYSAGFSPWVAGAGVGVLVFSGAAVRFMYPALQSTRERCLASLVAISIPVSAWSFSLLSLFTQWIAIKAMNFQPARPDELLAKGMITTVAFAICTSFAVMLALPQFKGIRKNKRKTIFVLTLIVTLSLLLPAQAFPVIVAVLLVGISLAVVSFWVFRRKVFLWFHAMMASAWRWNDQSE